jgi:hypothetical protein
VQKGNNIMNDIIVTTQITPFDHNEDDGFDLVAASAATLRAQFLDFKKGRWLLGPEKIEVPYGTQSIIYAAKEGWRYWMKGEPTRFIPRVKDEPFPARNELGDLDEQQWVIFDGKRRDPWGLEVQLLMVDRRSGQPMIYCARSWSAREQVVEFCRLVSYQRGQRGDNAKCIAALGSNERARVGGDGTYDVPVLDIVGWAAPASAPEPTAAPSVEPEPEPEKPVRTQRRKPSSRGWRAPADPAPQRDTLAEYLDDGLPAHLK